MDCQKQAREIFNGCHDLIERYKTVEVVFHHRILAKHFAVMIVDRVLNNCKKEAVDDWIEVKRILVEEYIWKRPEKPEL